LTLDKWIAFGMHHSKLTDHSTHFCGFVFSAG